MRITLTDRNPKDSTVWFKGAESMLAGAGAGLVSSVVTCPLDVIKTKLQASGASATGTAGLVDTFTKIWKTEGFRGLYRGLGPTIFGYLPTWAIYFTVYDKVKVKMGEIKGADAPMTHIVAAMSAGATGTIVTNPLWVIKTRFMTQETSAGEPRYRHTLDAIKRIYRTEGLRSFYRGLVPSLMGVSHIAVQFPLYERLKVYNRPADGSDIPSSTILFCSSISKMVASVATYPHEVLRTRLQVQKHATNGVVVTRAGPDANAAHPSTFTSSSSRVVGLDLPKRGSLAASPSQRPSSTASSSITTNNLNHNITRFEGIADTFRRIVRDEGYRGFYRGMGVNLLRTVPASALTILTYEIMMRRLYSYSHPEGRPTNP